MSSMRAGTVSVYLAVIAPGLQESLHTRYSKRIWWMEGWREGREGRHEVSSEVWKIWLSLDKWRPWKKEMEKGKYSRQEGSMYKCRRMSVVVITVDADIRATPVVCPGHS